MSKCDNIQRGMLLAVTIGLLILFITGLAVPVDITADVTVIS